MPHSRRPSDVASDILQNNAESPEKTSSEEGGESLNLEKSSSLSSSSSSSSSLSSSPSTSASTDLIELPKATNEGVRVANVDRNKKKKEKSRKKNKKKKNKKKKKVPSPVISYKVSSKRFQQLKAAMVNKGEKDILRFFFLHKQFPHLSDFHTFDQKFVEGKKVSTL